MEEPLGLRTRIDGREDTATSAFWIKKAGAPKKTYQPIVMGVYHGMEEAFTGFVGNVRRHTKNKCGVGWSELEQTLVSFVVDNFYFKKHATKPMEQIDSILKIEVETTLLCA